jgi:hypothetical protein
MPYGDAYSYVPPEGEGQPYEYVYYPSHGWTWVVAPWIWGFGPWPYFGVYGPAHFGWYGHGWRRSPWRWRFRPAAPFHGGFASHGFRSALPVAALRSMGSDLLQFGMVSWPVARPAATASPVVVTLEGAVTSEAVEVVAAVEAVGIADGRDQRRWQVFRQAWDGDLPS